VKKKKKKARPSFSFFRRRAQKKKRKEFVTSSHRGNWKGVDQTYPWRRRNTSVLSRRARKGKGTEGPSSKCAKGTDEKGDHLCPYLLLPGQKKERISPGGKRKKEGDLGSTGPYLNLPLQARHGVNWSARRR